MRVRILGNGGFRNQGLPGNAMLVNGRLLLETPPDIIRSLGEQGVNLADIEAVWISHVHGDHCFGFPFFFFNWLLAQRGRPERKLTVMGPQGLRERLRLLLELAISPTSQYIQSFEHDVELREVTEGECVPMLDGMWAGFVSTDHPVPTLAIILSEQSAETLDELCRHARFAYSSDTRYSERLEYLLRSAADLVLCDVNGSGNDDMHLSAEGLVELAHRAGVQGAGAPRILAGTHLSEPSARIRAGLVLVRSGDEFLIQ